MSINTYLSLEKLRQIPGFVEAEEKKLRERGTPIKFGGVDIWLNGDRPHVLDRTPESLASAVEEFSVYETVPFYVHREPGIYRHKSVRAEVDFRDDSTNKKVDRKYAIRVTCKDPKEAEEFLELFRLGKIRPKLEDSFEATQVGLGPSEVEALRAEVKRLEGLELYARGKFDQLFQFTEALSKTRWPFCWRASIVRRLRVVAHY